MVLKALPDTKSTTLRTRDGLYGESERDYPIFVSKLGYKDEPSFIANVLNVWWNDSAIIIEQNNNYWWIITAADSRLSYGDRYVGPLSEQRKDSIIHAEKNQYRTDGA